MGPTWGGFVVRVVRFPPHKENKGSGKGKRTNRRRHNPKANPTSIGHMGTPEACPCVHPQTGANPRAAPHKPIHREDASPRPWRAVDASETVRSARRRGRRDRTPGAQTVQVALLNQSSANLVRFVRVRRTSLGVWRGQNTRRRRVDTRATESKLQTRMSAQASWHESIGASAQNKSD